MTHEGFIHTVRALVCQRLHGKEREKLQQAKLVYGIGGGGYRGITCYEGWEHGGKKGELIEIAATGEESPIQLAGTTIHELGHCLCGPGFGHGKEWKAACSVLGLNAKADGQDYRPEDFDPDLWEDVNAIIELKDGKPLWKDPVAATGLITFTRKIRPCPLGIGSRGGKTRGPGSGSRLRLWICSCGIRARVSSDDFQAICKRCGADFRAVTSAPSTREFKEILDAKFSGTRNTSDGREVD
jgi:hypothetical protein